MTGFDKTSFNFRFGKTSFNFQPSPMEVSNDRSKAERQALLIDQAVSSISQAQLSSSNSTNAHLDLSKITPQTVPAQELWRAITSDLELSSVEALREAMKQYEEPFLSIAKDLLEKFYYDTHLDRELPASIANTPYYKDGRLILDGKFSSKLIIENSGFQLLCYYLENNSPYLPIYLKCLFTLAPICKTTNHKVTFKSIAHTKLSAVQLLLLYDRYDLLEQYKYPVEHITRNIFENNLFCPILYTKIEKDEKGIYVLKKDFLDYCTRSKIPLNIISYKELSKINQSIKDSEVDPTLENSTLIPTLPETETLSVESKSPSEIVIQNPMEKFVKLESEFIDSLVEMFRFTQDADDKHSTHKILAAWLNLQARLEMYPGLINISDSWIKFAKRFKEQLLLHIENSKSGKTTHLSVNGSSSFFCLPYEPYDKDHKVFIKFGDGSYHPIFQMMYGNMDRLSFNKLLTKLNPPPEQFHMFVFKDNETDPSMKFELTLSSLINPQNENSVNYYIFQGEEVLKGTLNKPSSFSRNFESIDPSLQVFRETTGEKTFLTVPNLHEFIHKALRDQFISYLTIRGTPHLIAYDFALAIPEALRPFPLPEWLSNPAERSFINQISEGEFHSTTILKYLHELPKYLHELPKESAKYRYTADTHLEPLPNHNYILNINEFIHRFVKVLYTKYDSLPIDSWRWLVKCLFERLEDTYVTALLNTRVEVTVNAPGYTGDFSFLLKYILKELQIYSDTNSPKTPPQVTSKPVITVPENKETEMEKLLLMPFSELIVNELSSNKLIHNHLLNALREENGKFQFNITKENGPIILKPFLKLIKSKNLCVNKIFQDFFNFLGFYRLDSVNPYERLEATELLRTFYSESSIRPKGDLLSSQMKEVAETFLLGKLQELKLRMKAGKVLPYADMPISSLPCFVIAQDKQKVHLEVLTADMQGKSLVGMSSDKGLSKAFLEAVGIQEIIETERRVEALVSQDEFKKLLDYSKEHPCIILEREKFHYNPPEEEPAQPEPMEVDRTPIKRGKEEVDDNEEEVKVKKPRRSSDDENNNNAAPKKRKAQLESEKLRHPFEITETGAYQEIDDAHPRKKVKHELKTGVLNVPNPMEVKHSEQESNDCDDPDALWNYLTERSTMNILKKVEKETAKLTAVNAEKPLNYPCMEFIEKAKKDPLKPLVLLNRLLKGYQKEDLDRLVHYLKHGLSVLLSYEMGVGKTFAYGSALLNEVFQGLNQHGVVITPKAITKTIYQDLIRIFQEGIYTAFILLMNSNRNEALNEIQIRIKRPKVGEDKLTLMMLSECTETEIENCFKSTNARDMIRGNFASKEWLSEGAFNIWTDYAIENLQKLQKSFKEINSPKLSIIEETFARLEKQEELNPYARLKLLAELITLNPDRSPIPIPINNEEKDQMIAGAKRLLTFELSRIVLCTDAQQFAEVTSSKNSPQVVVGSYEHFQALQGKPKPPIQMLVFDEMQRIQKMHTKLSQSIRQILETLPNTKKIGVTGTPMENEFNELLTLLNTVNKGLFDENTFNALEKLVTESLSQLQAQDEAKAFSACLTSFIHFAAFRSGPLKDLVIRRTQDEKRVVDDWEGRVTKIEEAAIEPIALSKEFEAKNSEIEENFRTKKITQFQFNTLKSRLSLHPALEKIDNFDLNNSDVQAFLRKIKSGSEEEKKKLIEDSPILSFISTTSKTQELIVQKLHAVGFVESKVIGQATQNYLEAKQIKVKFFHGDLTDDEKQSRIDWFKNTEEEGPKFFLSTYNVGGLGFSLPEANQVWFLQNIYNPGKIKQALYRAKRVGNAKTVQLIKPQFTTFSAKHMQSILDNKNSLFEFFFEDFDSLEEQFNSWVGYLVDQIYHKYLNESKNEAKARLKVEPIKEFVSEKIIGKIEEELLSQGVEKVMPKPQIPPLPVILRTYAAAQEVVRAVPPVAPIQTAPQAIERPKEGSLHSAMNWKKLPFKGMKMDQGIKIGAIIKEDPTVKEHVNTALNHIKKDVMLRGLIRSEKLVAVKHQDLIEALQTIDEKAQALEGDPFTRYRIEIYRPDPANNMKYVLKSILNDNAQRTIRLLRFGEKQEFDLLI